MTDTNDPFAQRPYVPPTERSDAGEATPASPEPPTADANPPEQTPPAPEAPTVETPAAESGPDAGADAEPTIPVAPVPPAAPEPPTVEQPAAMTSDPPAAAPAPPAESYTHRYADAAPSQPSPEVTQTDPFPPFAAPAAFPADGGGNDQPPVKKKRRGRTLVGAVALLLLAGGAGFGGAALQDKLSDDDNGSPAVSSLDTGDKATNTSVPAGAVEQVAKKVLPSVVQINVKGSDESGSGTGIIISSDGQILTNNHVTAVAGKDGIITVAFSDGSYARAKVVGADPKTDLAVIKADGKSGLTPATLGSSSNLEVGQEVVAIGSPFGLESTVTQGIISALNRPVTSSDGESSSSSNTFPAIQTDAAINPGNSGGPLVDIEGNVIGINSAIKASSSGEGGSIGLGFAIPIDLAKNVSKHLVKGEKVEHAQIGVTVRPAVSDDGITGTGAEIDDVTGGGAGDKAGLKKGDIITAVNGDLVASSEALVASVRGFQPGQKITLTYTRDGKKNEVEVTLGSDGGTSS
ncbi:trypsin-like peptidase domain-containing protein [Aeromicrobium sp. Root236]|uniref:trypsin-like peptidase domain-containing protein n=1 Tax=Aeromicrobium sp. Root236 TaxID=1736498 RepID=UPI000ACCC5B6|nr:trypsin-like peptidase domain-containing protein [Aeromicrobium sp. Root236]